VAIYILRDRVRDAFWLNSVLELGYQPSAMVVQEMSPLTLDGSRTTSEENVLQVKNEEAGSGTIRVLLRSHYVTVVNRHEDGGKVKVRWEGECLIDGLAEIHDHDSQTQQSTLNQREGL
jgi:hypothetical protein